MPQELYCSTSRVDVEDCTRTFPSFGSSSGLAITRKGENHTDSADMDSSAMQLLMVMGFLFERRVFSLTI